MLRKDGKLQGAATIIDESVASKKGRDESVAWHIRGFIYKDIYLQVDKGVRTSEARETAIESLKKSMELDENGTYLVQNRKVLKLLAISYYNDAIDILRAQDPVTLDEANDQYFKYKDLVIYQYPDTNMKDKDIEFYLAMSTGHRMVYEKNRLTYADHNKRQREYLKMVLELDPESFSANYSLSVSFYNQGARNLEKLPDVTNFPDIYEITSESMQSIEMALPFMMRAHEINPEKIEAIKGLKWIYFNLHLEEESRQMEEKLRSAKNDKD